MKYDRFFKLPEGAISLETVDRVYLDRILEAGGADDLIPVLHSFTLGLVLEEQGKIKEAQDLYKKSLKCHPENPWIKEASRRIRYTLN